ncbi:MAG: hypothetical protein U0793_22475 [Gemmataceae bacterium]
MGFPSRLALGAVIVLAPVASAQESGSKEVRPNHAEVRFGDGSLVRVTIMQETLDVMTKYGKLTIPIQEIRRIDFGLHLPPGVDAKIDASIKQLGSPAFKEREDAMKTLVYYGPMAFPFVQRASHSPELEVASRAATIVKRISEKSPPELLSLKEDDIIQTAEFPIVGRVMSDAIKAQSSHFGELNLKLSDLRNLFVRGPNAENEWVVDAAKHGSAPDQWLDTGIVVDASQRMVISSEGQVDLWPQGPGQYLTTPKGYTAAGKGGAFMAGALVAKVGAAGKPFLVGDRFEGAPSEEGKLYLHIVPSPWNNASAGTYRVRMSCEHVALSARR